MPPGCTCFREGILEALGSPVSNHGTFLFAADLTRGRRQKEEHDDTRERGTKGEAAGGSSSSSQSRSAASLSPSRSCRPSKRAWIHLRPGSARLSARWPSSRTNGGPEDDLVVHPRLTSPSVCLRAGAIPTFQPLPNLRLGTRLAMPAMALEMAVFGEQRGQPDAQQVYLVGFTSAWRF